MPKKKEIGDMEFMDVMDSVDSLTVKQSYKVMLHLKQCPPWDVDVLKEATLSFEALDDLQAYKFFKEIKTRYSKEDWSTLTED